MGDLEGEYDEESFMEKLNGYLTSKYGDEPEEDITDDPKQENKVNLQGLSAADILSMNDDDLDRLFSLNDTLDDSAESTLNEKSKGKRNRKRGRNRNQYRKAATNSKS